MKKLKNFEPNRSDKTKGVGTVRLREALDDLVEVYRKIGSGV